MSSPTSPRSRSGWRGRRRPSSRPRPPATNAPPPPGGGRGGGAPPAERPRPARHERLLGIKLRAVPQVYAERSSAHFPTEMYDSYTADESESVSGGPDGSRTTVQSLRKSRM